MVRRRPTKVGSVQLAGPSKGNRENCVASRERAAGNRVTAAKKSAGALAIGTVTGALVCNMARPVKNPSRTCRLHPLTYSRHAPPAPEIQENVTSSRQVGDCTPAFCQCQLQGLFCAHTLGEKTREPKDSPKIQTARTRLGRRFSRKKQSSGWSVKSRDRWRKKFRVALPYRPARERPVCASTWDAGRMNDDDRARLPRARRSFLGAGRKVKARYRVSTLQGQRVTGPARSWPPRAPSRQ
jgi:hypothetical protein